ncbi:MAG: GxxExxY protein [Planctomycetota bacterium]
MDRDDLPGRVIGAAIEVHQSLGPGLLESAYETCLAKELSLRNIPYERQVALPVQYKGEALDAGYRLDLVIDHQIILELKSVDQLMPIHTAQLLTYLKLSNLRIGYLFNFNVPLFKDGIKRIIRD